jgi:hypothetical protein
MIIVDILCVTAVFYLKFYLTRVVQLKNGDVIAEVVNAVQIQLLEYTYTKIGTHYYLRYLSSLLFMCFLLLNLSIIYNLRALVTHRYHRFCCFHSCTFCASVCISHSLQLPAFIPLFLPAMGLTNRENCRTDTQFEDSLIMKFFAFNFINSCKLPLSCHELAVAVLHSAERRVLCCKAALNCTSHLICQGPYKASPAPVQWSRVHDTRLNVLMRHSNCATTLHPQFSKSNQSLSLPPSICFCPSVVTTDASSFYIAFVKKSVGDFCTADSCMGELAQTHFIIFRKY